MNAKKPQPTKDNKRNGVNDQDYDEHDDEEDDDDDDPDTKEDRENRRRIVAELAKNTKLRELAETRKQFILLTASQKKTTYNNLKFVANIYIFKLKFFLIDYFIVKIGFIVTTKNS